MEQHKLDIMADLNNLIADHDAKKALVEAAYNDPYYIEQCKIVEQMAVGIANATEEWRDEMRHFEAAIKLLTLQLGESYDTMTMEIKYRKGHERTIWDTKALAVHAELNPSINQYRKSRTILPSVSITTRSVETVS